MGQQKSQTSKVRCNISLNKKLQNHRTSTETIRSICALGYLTQNTNEGRLNCIKLILIGDQDKKKTQVNNNKLGVKLQVKKKKKKRNKDTSFRSLSSLTTVKNRDAQMRGLKYIFSLKNRALSSHQKQKHECSLSFSFTTALALSFLMPDNCIL